MQLVLLSDSLGTFEWEAVTVLPRKGFGLLILVEAREHIEIFTQVD
jgi:hypothetical protein